MEAFVHNAYVQRSGVEDFILSFGDDDPEALVEYLTELEGSKLPAAGYREGYDATVTAIKANEAVTSRTSIALEDRLYDLG